MTNPAVSQHYNFFDLFLDLENPRTGKLESSLEAIANLAKDKKLVNLAADIQSQGLNPLDPFALLPGPHGTYTVAEGNRRLCALMLLHDPALAPADVRAKFQELHSKGNIPDKVAGVLFQDREAVNIWLLRLHTSKLEGVNRQKWTPDQIARFCQDKRYEFTLEIVDYAKTNGIIAGSDISSNLSIIEPYLSSEAMRSALGLTVNSKGNLQSQLGKQTLNEALSLFFKDVKDKIITTRSHPRSNERFESYAGELISRLPNTPKIVQNPQELKPKKHKHTIATENVDESNSAQSLPKPSRISHSSNTQKLLVDLNIYKLDFLYRQLTKLRVKDYTIIVSVGMWSFFDSLTSLHGKPKRDNFVVYTNKQYEKLGLKSHANMLRTPLSRISDNGNADKHDQSIASYNDTQIIEDFNSLERLINAYLSACIKARVA